MKQKRRCPSELLDVCLEERADDHKNKEIWTWNGGWRKKKTQKEVADMLGISSPIYQTGEKDYAKIASGDGEVFMKNK